MDKTIEKLDNIVNELNEAKLTPKSEAIYKDIKTIFSLAEKIDKFYFSNMKPFMAGSPADQFRKNVQKIISGCNGTIKGLNKLDKELWK